MLVRALGAVLAFTVCGSAQEAGRMQFVGRGEIGTTVDLRITGGVSNAAMVVILTPQVGSFTSPELSTDCFATASGFVFLELNLNQQGSTLQTIVVPNAPVLTGVYLVGQGFELTAGLPRTTCASFVVVAATPTPAVFETFDTAAQHDTAISAAAWSTDVLGVVAPAPIGGSGELGSFDHRHGTLRGTEPEGPWVFDTDDHVFPATATLFGQPIRVTDGIFQFLELTIPAGVIVRFEGSKAARILVAGHVRIDGILDVSAPDAALAAGTDPNGEGQAGGAGGAGGGVGGDGGDLPTVVLGAVDGAPGEDLRVMPGSALDGNVASTGGRGSVAIPSGADPEAVTYGFFGFYSNQMAGGAGGGGWSTAGTAGVLITERAPGGETGLPGAGGLAIAAPATSSTSRRDLLVGGTGGGGTGVHPYDSLIGQPVQWARGSGGAGGGGACLIASGGDIEIGLSGIVRADGGSTAARTEADGLLLAPGGAGSGGSLLFQGAGAFRNEGIVSAVGGIGGTTEDRRVTQGTATAGGSGGDGLIRVETTVATSLSDLGTMTPNAGPGTAAILGEVETLTLAASRWYGVPVTGDATNLDYEVYTVQDALSVIYSDRPGFGSGPVGRGATPIVLFTRFGRLDAQGLLVSGTEGPWTEGSAAPVTDANGIQFLLYFDRSGQGPVGDLRVEAVRLGF